MSCRLGKGTHKAMNRFQAFAYKASKNHTKTVWVLKCDIRKFFASINQRTLLHIVHEHIQDKDILWLIQEIVSSFYSIDRQTGTGLPLGNLTSQLFVNIYMNKFDQFVKHKLKARHYIRYADDFVILSSDREWLLKILPKIQAFLKQKLFLDLHPDKISIETIYSGVDFLGWVHFSDHKILRAVTKKRMLRRIQAIKGAGDFEIIQSYLGLISHGNTKKLKQRITSN